MCLTSLQKCNRARWQMLFHPTVLRLEFCNPLTFGQMCISCAFYALPGWNLTKKNLLLINNWSVPPNPLSHTSSWLVSGIYESHPPPFPLWITKILWNLCCSHSEFYHDEISRMRSTGVPTKDMSSNFNIMKCQYIDLMCLHVRCILIGNNIVSKSYFSYQTKNIF